MVDGFTLGHRTVEQSQARIPGADARLQVLAVGHLPGVGGLVPQHQRTMGQAAPVYAVRPRAQAFEHMRKRQRNNKMVGGVGI